jgi:multiple sugar transport system permease protein
MMNLLTQPTETKPSSPLGESAKRRKSVLRESPAERLLYALGISFAVIVLGVPVLILILVSATAVGGWSLSNYGVLFGLETTDDSYNTAVQYFSTGLLNSFIVSCVATVVVVVASIPPAYVLGRMVSRRVMNISVMSLIALRVLPPMTLMIPIYIFATTSGLTNSRILTGVLYAAFEMPYVIWILSGFFHRLPGELEEAALLDGCSKFGALRHILLPLALPGLFASALFTFVYVWSDMFVSLLMLATPESRTLPVLLSSFVTGIQSTPYGLVMASGVIAVIIPAALAVALRRLVVGGLALEGQR